MRHIAMNCIIGHNRLVEIFIQGLCTGILSALSFVKSIDLPRLHFDAVSVLPLLEGFIYTRNESKLHYDITNDL